MGYLRGGRREGDSRLTRPNTRTGKERDVLERGLRMEGGNEGQRGAPPSWCGSGQWGFLGLQCAGAVGGQVGNAMSLASKRAGVCGCGEGGVG